MDEQDVIPARWHHMLDGREIRQVEFACTYHRRFNHGAPGHLDMLVISKLCFVLEAADATIADLTRELADARAGRD